MLAFLSHVREQGLLWPLITLYVSFFLAYTNVSAPYPFLGNALKDHHVDSISIGVAYAMHPMGIAVAQFFTERLENRYGTVKMHSGGFLLAGSCTLLIAFAFDIMTSPGAAAGFVIGVRFLQGMGEGITDNAMISMYQINYKDEVGKVLGISEGAVGLGMAVGPLLGGVLYNAGGYRTPLIVVSVPLLVLGSIGSFLLKDLKCRQDVGTDATSSEASAEPKPHSHVLTAIVSIGIFVVFTGLGCVTPLFPIYFKDEFGWNEAAIGAIFAVGGTCYFVCGMFTGHLSDENVKKPCPSIYPFLVGPLISGLSYAAAGPFPGLPFSATLQKVFILTSVPFASIGQSFTLICGMGMLTLTARTHSVASSVFNASLNLGLAVGPVMGTTFYSQFGFRWAMALNMFLELSFLIIAWPATTVLMKGLIEKRGAATARAKNLRNLSSEFLLFPPEKKTAPAEPISVATTTPDATHEIP